MNIRWHNLFALLLVIIVILLALRSGPQIKSALDSMQQVGASHSPDDRLAGFMTFGLIGVCIVAIVKILTHQKSRGPRRDDNDREE